MQIVLRVSIKVVCMHFSSSKFVAHCPDLPDLLSGWGGRNNKGRKEEKDVGSQRRKRHRPGHKTNVDNANNLDADNTQGDKGE